MAVSKSLSIICQNTGGWSDPKAETLSTIIDLHKADMCFVQEHFKLAKNLYKINEQFKEFCVFSIPAYKTNNVISRGRPSGGLSIIYRKYLEGFVTEIIIPESKRVQAIHVKINNNAYVFINIYMPTDPQTNNFDDSELIKTLQDIRYVFSLYEPSVNFILMGDLNCDFQRNSRFVHIINNFLDEQNLVTVWNKFPVDFTYCHPTPNNERQYIFSTIDHFLVNENFIQNCVEGCVLHLGENLSKHELLFLKIDCEHYEKINPSAMHETVCVKPCWNKASIEQKEALLETFNSYLNQILVPFEALTCRNLQCKSIQHKEDIDQYAVSIMDALQSAVDQHIPHCGSYDRVNCVPGWNHYIKPIKDDLNFWHSVWVSAGKPVNTVLHQIYRNLRHQYHYAIRRIKSHKQQIKNENYVKAAAKGQMNDILKDIKNQRRGKETLPTTIDKISDPKAISEHFCEIYKKIYNHHDTQEQVNEIYTKLDENVDEEDFVWLQSITPQLITSVIKKLKPDKNDEAYSFKSNAFILTSYLLSEPLALLFKSYLVHGHFTQKFLFSSLVPIVKDNRKNRSDSSNYRLIAVSSILLKILDLLMVKLFPDELSVSNLQFGYQQSSSTILCSWTMRECINYFANRGSSIYLCLLDLTKAFDNIKLDKLFNKLSKKLPTMFVRLILHTYMMQQCYVKWSNCKSTSFEVKNGVRQGAVASPLFFNLYMDELFNILKDSGVGCKIDQFYYGILGYADDLSLLCPSRDGLQRMVDIVRSYCDENGIKISVNINEQKSKTKCILVNSKLHPVKIRLYGLSLPYVDRWIHLGTVIHKDEKSDYDVLKTRGEFISNIHSLYQELGRINPYLYIKLVNIYLSSFYGCCLWDLDSPSAHKLYSTWNTMIRNNFDLPYGTHRYILQQFNRRKPLQEELHGRFIKFLSHIKQSRKAEVLHLYHKQKHDSRSIFGRNYKNICIHKTNVIHPYIIPDGHTWKVNVVKELLSVRSENLFVPEFDDDDLQVILQELCCN